MYSGKPRNVLKLYSLHRKKCQACADIRIHGDGPGVVGVNVDTTIGLNRMVHVRKAISSVRGTAEAVYS